MLKAFTLFLAATGMALFGQEMVPVPIPHDPSTVLGLVAPIIGESPIIIEAGAFDGSDTVRMATIWPEGHIYSFEPVPFLFNESLKKTVGYPNVTLTNKALSNSTKMVDLHLSDVGGQPFQSSSIDAPHLHKEVFPWVGFNQTIRIQTTTIDRIMNKYKLNQIDFLWLDTEGHELPILQAFSKLEDAKVLYCEVAFVELRKNQALFGELTDFLASKGFVVAAVNFDCELVDGKVVPKAGNTLGDALYIKECYLHLFK